MRAFIVWMLRIKCIVRFNLYGEMDKCPYIAHNYLLV